MKIRFRESIATSRWSYEAGQVIEVSVVTPHLKMLLRDRPNGRPAVAEVVREDRTQTTVAPTGEAAAERHSGTRRSSGSRRRQEHDPLH